MRLALSSLIAIAALATAVHAQEPAVQPPPPVAAPPAAPDPGSATPPAAAPATTPPAAAPAPAAEAPAPPPPLPTLPTTGDGAAAIAVLEKVCVPAARGADLDALAKANGFKLNRREQTWIRPLSVEKGANKNHQIVIFPIGSNKGVCNAEIRHEVGGDEEIAKALNVWSFLHQPPLDPTANYTQPQDPDGLKRVRRSWEHLTATNSIGLNFSTVKNPDGTPVNAKYDLATMQYQERTF
ncbi:hypothetical protein [uncultured Phenylobacterium sp.]|uniref:hypothetical protein n=1 Tax=uncultured Phenylobacterium sp. TaxID=349273 RepID=UPI0025EB3716|nr:hypothetical protein [uncultured Phenylobacterium sp.]